LLAAAEAKAAEFAEEAAITKLVDKTKEITPAQMKKVAAGVLGVWGVASGAGWAMNQFSGSNSDV